MCPLMYADVKHEDAPISLSNLPIDLTRDEPLSSTMAALSTAESAPRHHPEEALNFIRLGSHFLATRYSSPTVSESNESTSDASSSTSTSLWSQDDNDDEDSLAEEREAEALVSGDNTQPILQGRKSHCDYYTQISYKVYRCGSNNVHREELVILRQSAEHAVIGRLYIIIIALLLGAVLMALVYCIATQLPPHYLLD